MKTNLRGLRKHRFIEYNIVWINNKRATLVVSAQLLVSYTLSTRRLAVKMIRAPGPSIFLYLTGLSIFHILWNQGSQTLQKRNLKSFSGLTLEIAHQVFHTDCAHFYNLSHLLFNMANYFFSFADI